jgi:hypothetical protein
MPYLGNVCEALLDALELCNRNLKLLANPCVRPDTVRGQLRPACECPTVQSLHLLRTFVACAQLRPSQLGLSLLGELGAN